MSALQPFAPAYGSGVKLTTGLASANVAITPSRNLCCRIVNRGPGVAWFRIGYDSSLTALVDADVMLLPGAQETFTRPLDASYFAAIADQANTVLQLINGEGL